MVHHVISRFVDRDWFIRDDDERGRYLALLARAISASDWRCLAYAIMSNHIHLAVVAGESSLESWIKRVHSPFAHWMNHRRNRLGALFAGRPAVHIIPSANEANLLAYIHNNPVRAGLVARARQSTWTSHNQYRRPGSAPWLAAYEGLRRAGFADDPALFDDWVDITICPDFEYEPLEVMRRRARWRGGVELGTPRSSTPREVPLLARPSAHVRPNVEAVLAVVAALTQVSPDRLASRSTARDVSRGRSLVVKFGKELGLVSSEIEAALGISSSAVSKHWTRAMTGSERDALDECHRMLQTVRTVKSVPNPQIG